MYKGLNKGMIKRALQLDETDAIDSAVRTLAFDKQRFDALEEALGGGLGEASAEQRS